MKWAKALKGGLLSGIKHDRNRPGSEIHRIGSLLNVPNPAVPGPSPPRSQGLPSFVLALACLTPRG
jgi:hypothetical protein